MDDWEIDRSNSESGLLKVLSLSDFANNGMPHGRLQLHLADIHVVLAPSLNSSQFQYPCALHTPKT
jgi:hypothetical protein